MGDYFQNSYPSTSKYKLIIWDSLDSPRTWEGLRSTGIIEKQEFELKSD